MKKPAEKTTPPAPSSTASSTESAGSDEKTPSKLSPHAQKAQGVVRRNVYWALGLGLIPVPLVDFVALTGVQVKMLKELSELYGVKFFEDKTKTIIGSLIAGLGSRSLAGLVARSVFKLIPGYGLLIGTLGGAAFGGALTLAIGNLFVMHYESGGTLLDFDPDQLRSYFNEELAKAKSAVKTMQTEKEAEPVSR